MHIVKRADTLVCEGTETRAFCIRHPNDPDRIQAIPVPEEIKALCSSSSRDWVAANCGSLILIPPSATASLNQTRQRCITFEEKSHTFTVIGVAVCTAVFLVGSVHGFIKRGMGFG